MSINVRSNGFALIRATCVCTGEGGSEAVVKKLFIVIRVLQARQRTSAARCSEIELQCARESGWCSGIFVDRSICGFRGI